MRTLKSYVRNKAHPEGSIARGYLADECLTFCYRYMDNMNTKFNRKSQNDDEDQEAPSKTELDLDIFRPLGRPLGKSTLHHLSLEEFQ